MTAVKEAMVDPATSTTRRVLVVEDDADVMDLLEFNLLRAGYEMCRCTDGLDALHLAEEWAPDLIVLDIMLPGLDGVQICKELRQHPTLRQLPVLMLTARSEETDQLGGFEAGADDYVTKPFSVRVLLERIRLLLERRASSGGGPDRLRMHGISLDRLGHEVTSDGERLALTPTEFRLLCRMMEAPGRAFRRGDLLEAAVGDDTIVLERTIDVHIRSLRRKLGARAGVIETVRGVGYRFAREE